MERNLVVPLVLIPELLFEIAVAGHFGVSGKLDGAVLAVDLRRDHRVIGEHALQKDGEFAGVVDRHQEDIGDIAAILVHVEAAACGDPFRVHAVIARNRYEEG